MLIYRITKDNPKQINSKLFNGDNWKYYHQIGDSFNDKILTLKEYINVENLYIQLINHLVIELDESQMIFRQNLLENFDSDSNFTPEMFRLFEKIGFQYKIKYSEIPSLLKLIFRGYLNGRLIGENITIEFNNCHSVIVKLNEYDDKIIDIITSSNVYCEKLN